MWLQERSIYLVSNITIYESLIANLSNRLMNLAGVIEVTSSNLWLPCYYLSQVGVTHYLHTSKPCREQQSRGVKCLQTDSSFVKDTWYTY